MRLTTGRGLKGISIRQVSLRMRNGLPLNNNRNNNNNRRRGRGNRNQGGGNQANRIDSRARGNAPQLLDKYKKLAEDAHRNGDRVQAEYYLQFADHYFRVIADNRARQDEQRGGDQRDTRAGRRDDREQDDFESEFEDDGDDRRRFESRDRDDRNREDRSREDRSRERAPRRDRNRQDAQREDEADTGDTSAFEPDDNPFVRDSRDRAEPRDARPKRRAARPRRETEDRDIGFDAAALPPSLSANDTANDTVSNQDGGESSEPAPRRRRKRDDGGTLSAVG